MKLVTVAEMKTIESAANASGWSYAQMMQAAGKGLAEALKDYEADDRENIVLGLVGAGNNGGDSLIALTALAQQGWRVLAYVARERDPQDALLSQLKQTNAQIVNASDDLQGKLLDDWLHETTLILDGVLGTGARLPLQAQVARVLAQVKAYPDLPVVVAVDCPSGVDLESGEVAEETIPADRTLCMAAIKTGLLQFPAFEYAGEMQVIEIGLPVDLPAWQAVQAEVIGAEWVHDHLPERSAVGHKGTFGTVTVAAGSLNYCGAALLCSRAAYRIGAGLVQVAVPTPVHAVIAGQLIEATWKLLPHSDGAFCEASADALEKAAEHTSVLLWGPGLGTSDATADFARRLILGRGAKNGGMGFVSAASPQASASQASAVKLPAMVVDADALKLIARLENGFNRLPAESVLTPHPGEMGVMTGLKIEEIQADRITTAAKFAKEWGQVVVLKGAMTVIAAPDGRIGVIPLATSALAKGGTGDVLAGMIAGLRAQGMAGFEAACAASWLHANSGIAAAGALGHEAPVLASDVIEALPGVLAWVW